MGCLEKIDIIVTWLLGIANVVAMAAAAFYACKAYKASIQIQHQNAAIQLFDKRYEIYRMVENVRSYCTIYQCAGGSRKDKEAALEKYLLCNPSNHGDLLKNLYLLSGNENADSVKANKITARMLAVAKETHKFEEYDKAQYCFDLSEEQISVLRECFKRTYEMLVGIETCSDEEIEEWIEDWKKFDDLEIETVMDKQIREIKEEVNLSKQQVQRLYIKRLLVVAIVVWIAFIWGHSMIPASGSAEESRVVGNFLCPFLEIFVGKGQVTDHLVRKLAHFTEYAVLGFLTGAYRVSRISEGANEATCMHDIVRNLNEDIREGRRKHNLSGYGSRKSLWTRVFFVAAVACIDESVQLFVPGRGAQLRDVILDICGGIAGLLAVWLCAHLVTIKRFRS